MIIAMIILATDEPVKFTANAATRKLYKALQMPLEKWYDMTISCC
jgi:hypothetical protein